MNAYYNNVTKINVNKTKEKNKKKFKAMLPYLLMALPGLLYLLINNYLPMIGLSLAFKDIDFAVGLFKSPWNGLKNFEFLFRTSDAWIITRNTIGYNVSFIIIGTAFSVFIAILLNEVKNKFFLKIYQSLVLLPFLISMVIVAYLVYAALSVNTGFINKSILPLFGVERGIEWYNEPEYWPFILVIVNTWRTSGYTCIVYLASLVGINKEYFEAADLDGATKLQQIRLITLPLIKPVIIMMVLFSIGRIFYSDFGLFYQVTMDSGMIYSTTNVIDTFVYRGLLQIGDIGMSSAAGVYQSVVGFIIVMLSNWIVRRRSAENALF